MTRDERTALTEAIERAIWAIQEIDLSIGLLEDGRSPENANVSMLKRKTANASDSINAILSLLNATEQL